MPLTVRELATSRGFEISTSGASLTVNLIAYRSDDEDEVLTDVLASGFAPFYFDGLIRTGIKPTPQGGGIWHVDVTYGGGSGAGNANGTQPAGATPGSPASPTDGTELGDTQGNGFSFEFDISQNTAHITQSIATVETQAAAGEVAPNYQQAIGVTKDGIEGCDIFDGKLEITVGVTRSSVTFPYIRSIKNLVGKTNNAAWCGFEAGSVLYLGATGRSVSDGLVPKFSVSHRLGIGENQSLIAVGNGIIVNSKKAWEYLWCVYKEKEVGGALFQVPVAAYVEQVFRAGNFDILEIS